MRGFEAGQPVVGTAVSFAASEQPRNIEGAPLARGFSFRLGTGRTRRRYGRPALPIEASASRAGAGGGRLSGGATGKDMNPVAKRYYSIAHGPCAGDSKKPYRLLARCHACHARARPVMEICDTRDKSRSVTPVTPVTRSHRKPEAKPIRCRRYRFRTRTLFPPRNFSHA